MSMRGIFVGVVVAIAILLPAPASAATTNNYAITSFDTNYTLSRDDANRSVLKTTETITADFPQANQNHGLERAIPNRYDKHSVGLKIDSVTDTNKVKLPYTTYDSKDYTVLRIGNKNTYVHGSTTYVIAYTQHDVTKAYRDNNSDEFYWDTNGTEWKVPINALSVTLKIDESLIDQLTGKVACYQGEYGSSSKCDLVRSGNSFSTTATTLAAGSNVSVAIGFLPETFAGYQQNVTEKIFKAWVMLQIVLAFVAAGLLIWLLVRYNRASNRTSEHAPIVPEYLPPKNGSLEVAAQLVGSTKGSTAQLIDLAVRHYIKIYQTKKKTGLFGSDDYMIEVVKPLDDLRPEEKEILNDILVGNATVGNKITMSTLKNNTAVYNRVLDNPKKVRDLINEKYYLRAKDSVRSAWLKSTAIFVGIAALILLSPALLLVAIVAAICQYTLRPLTDEGLALLRYLKGLKMYISVAEEQRIKMLQSPEGAAKVHIDGNDQVQLVKLYERVLPYAILFGQEKDWNKQLGKYYETTNTQPEWYSGYGNSAFNAALFSNAINSFNSSASYASSSSSSSSGSGGGGFSGGGGGGGGGGGW